MRHTTKPLFLSHIFPGIEHVLCINFCAKFNVYYLTQLKINSMIAFEDSRHSVWMVNIFPPQINWQLIRQFKDGWACAHARESSSSQQQQHQHHSESALRLEFQIESIDLFNLRGGDIEINICQIQRDDIEWVSWVRGERWCDKNYVSSLLLWIYF